MSGTLTTRAEFEAALDAVLDARRDPLMDVELRAWALEHPEDAAELCELQTSLAMIASVELPLRSLRRLSARRLAVVTALVLLVAGIPSFLLLDRFVLSQPRLTAAQELELHPIVPAPALGSVWSWEQIDVFESSRGTRTLRASEGRVVFEDELRVPAVQLEGALARAEILSTSDESWIPQ